MKSVRTVLSMLVIALPLLIGGCETFEHAAQTDAEVERQVAPMASKMGVPKDAQPYADIVNYLDATTQYVATDPVEIKHDSGGVKRSHLKCHINLATDEPISLLEAAQLLTRECKVPVRVTQDAMQQIAGAAGSLQSTGQAAGGGPAGAHNVVPSIPSSMGGLQGSGPQNSYAGAFGDNGLIDVNFDGEAEEFLDMLAARMGGLSWREMNDGTIKIYALDTKTFSVSALATDTTTMDSNFQSGTTSTNGATSDSNGAGGGGGGGGGGSGSATGNGTNTTMQQTSVRMKSNLWDDIQKALNTMTGQGNAIVAPSTGTVTVRGNVDTLDAVSNFVSFQNKRLEKGVDFHIQVYSVTLNNQDSGGINWNAMYQALGGVGMTFAGGFTAPAGAVAAGFSVLKSSTSPLAGSEAIISALNQQGRTKLEREQDLPTLNFNPVGTQVGQQQGYVAGEQQTNTANVGSSTAIQLGTITVGFNVSLLPYIQDDNNILVQFNLNLSNLDNIRQISTNGAYAEAPQIDLPLNTVQKVKVTPGETLVLTGINNVDDTSTRTGTGWHWNWLLGGGATTNRTHTVLIVLITPILRS
jgi:type IVB pilus formation R64 PilN family outer membrane protein